MSGTTYPSTPPGWTPVESRSIGPFTTHVTFQQEDGTTVAWSSRSHRKHASLLSRVRGRRERLHRAARHASWWIGILFAAGSVCFLVAPMPWFFDLVSARTDALVFFVGSLLFTSAAALQWLETINADPGPAHPAGRLRIMTFEPRRIDWWSSGVQLVGTVFFNFTTFRALQTSVESMSYDQLVWRPDALGSVCFLVSGYLAYVEVSGRLWALPKRTLESRIVTVNLMGCIAFGIAAVASYVVPSTDAMISVGVTNLFTSLGALGFLIGAILLLPEGSQVPDSQTAKA
ncbi:MAG TPA: hypothetical protein VHI11_04280 [Jiangellaceae bacterium]|jgi:hypothetical protein|nr:hypothetical protein [Jiangellaceae bacterium]